MPIPLDVDIWLRGRDTATTTTLPAPETDAGAWTEADVRTLLTEMLLALERLRNPGGDPPPVTLRGFSWIVSDVPGGVLVHLELTAGTASAGPFAVDGTALSAMISRVIHGRGQASGRVH